ncbi:MAG: hypothetical protein FWC43_08700 [Planctomycetaceae bacterium]|nr:hypothetical protein [Planctomycetaceae bacterium]MCL2305274.1 hypothetical protein [Planctomycetaceae bacterium]MCL2305407.1 hypothetical protein [Planctomycetaceae bacterium]
MSHEHQSGCVCCGLSRRQFVAAGALAAAAGVTAVSPAKPVFAQETGKKMKIRVFFSLHADVQNRPDWPNIGFDFRPVMDDYMSGLKKVLPEVEFVSSLANGADAANQILAEDGDQVHGYIVFQMNCWNPVIQPVAATGKPTLYCDFSYAGSGGFLVYSAQLLRAKSENASFIASSQFSDILEAARCFEVIAKGGTPKEFVAAVENVRKERTKPYNKELKIVEDKVNCLSTEKLLEELKGVKILTIGQPWHQYAGAAKEVFGMDIVELPFADLNAAWDKAMAEKTEAQKIVDRWKKEAVTIENGITDEELFKSAAMFLAEKALLDEHGAMGITVNCLGGFYGGHIFAYPCLGFFELCNMALVGGCECDIRSALTMAVLTKMTQGRPGFISDPVMDVATRQIIYAHCVASTKMFGPDGPTNSYEILTHSEDRQGASLRSLAPTGYMTTTIEFDMIGKRILFHQAVAVANSYEDRACRTKICAEVSGDFEKLFSEWDQWGWHRVTVYGDLKKEIFELADAIGFTVLEEA